MEKKLTAFQKWEAYFSMLNHLMIVSVSLYVTWVCYHFGVNISKYSWHVWLCTIGYQLLMAEGILTFYSANNWSYFHSTFTKRKMHWVLQIFGAAFAIAGTVIHYIGRKTHFKSIHSITGLISLILLCITLANGIAALWARELSKITIIKPVWSKFVHNIIGISTFVIGMVSLYHGYKYKYFRDSDEKDIRPWLSGILIVTTGLSLIGAFKSLYSQFRTILD